MDTLYTLEGAIDPIDFDPWYLSPSRLAVEWHDDVPAWAVALGAKVEG